MSNNTLEVRVNIRYSTGALTGGVTTYDAEVDLTSDGRGDTLPLLVDAPIAFNFQAGFRMWGKKSQISYGSVKVFGQDWLTDVNQLTDKPPLIRIYVSRNGETEVLRWEGKSYHSKYLGNNIYEISLASIHEIYNEPVIGHEFESINPVDNIKGAMSFGRFMYQIEAIPYDLANNKYIVCNADNNETISVIRVSDKGDPLILGTDYSVSTITIDSVNYVMITLVNQAFGVVTVDIDSTPSTVTMVMENVITGMLDYKSIPYTSITDNIESYYISKGYRNTNNHGHYESGGATIKQIIDLFVDSVFGAWYSINGKDIILDPLKVPEDEVADFIIDENNILSEITSEIDTAPNLSMTINCWRNFRPLRESEIAASIPIADRQALMNPYRRTKSLDDAEVEFPTIPVDNFRKAETTHTGKQYKEGYTSTSQSPTRQPDRLAHLSKLYGDKTRRFYKVTATLSYLDVQLGQIAEINYDKLSGKKVQVVGIQGDLNSSKIKLTLWG